MQTYTRQTPAMRKAETRALELGQQIDAFITFQISHDPSIITSQDEHFGSTWTTLNENGAKLLNNFRKQDQKSFDLLAELVGNGRDQMEHGWLVRQFRNNWAWKL